MSHIDDEIQGYLDRYLNILGLHQRPLVKISSNLGSKWLGRCTWNPKTPQISLIELQKSIVSDPKTLERVIAHELVHHRDFMNMSPEQIKLIKMGLRPSDGHDSSFLEGARLINNAAGKDFVTVTSDQSYTKSKNERPFYLLIHPKYIPGKFGYAWAARLSDDMKAAVAKFEADGARLITTTDDRFTSGAKIKHFGGFSFPRDSEQQEALAVLYRTGSKA